MCYLMILILDYFKMLILPCLAVGLVKCHVKLFIAKRYIVIITSVTESRIEHLIHIT